MKLYIREQIKTLLAQEGLKIKDLSELITQKTGKPYSAGAISQKLNRGTMTYNEAINIAELLGYKVSFTKEE